MEVATIAAIKSFISRKVNELTCTDYLSSQEKIGESILMLPDLSQTPIKSHRSVDAREKTLPARPSRKKEPLEPLVELKEPRKTSHEDSLLVTFDGTSYPA